MHMLNLVVFRSITIKALACVFFPLLVVCQDFTHGTAIVILRTKDSILAAADSRLSSDNPLYSGTTCKIRTAGGIGIAIAGLYTEPESKFDAMQIALAAAQTEGTIFTKMQAFEGLIYRPLTTAWANILKRHPELNLKDFNTQIAFFGFYEDITFVIREKLFPVGHPLVGWSIDYQRRVFPTANTKDSLGLITMAQSKEILDALVQPFSADDWVQALNRMIQIAIDRRLDVGPPIVMLSLTRSGKRWIQKKQECPD
jgi:hypothetical protein